MVGVQFKEAGVYPWLVHIKVEDQKNHEIKQSYWSRAKFSTQGVYTRVQVHNMENLKWHKWDSTFPQNLVDLNWRKHTTQLEKPNFELEFALESKSKVHKGEPWTPCLLNLDPSIVNPPLTCQSLNDREALAPHGLLCAYYPFSHPTMILHVEMF